MTATADLTTAERISALLGDDGTVYQDSEGRDLAQLCEESGGAADERDSGTDNCLRRWVFSDGSAILDVGNAWDLGYAGCYCWRGDGHTDECRDEGDSR